MYASIETRWFLEPDAKEIPLIEAWFAKFKEWRKNEKEPRPEAPPVAFRKSGGEGVRTDYYLKIDGYPRFSFKVREGKTETKILDRDYGLEQFSALCVGRVEKWIKWGPDLLMENASPKDVFKDASEFIAMPKDRLLIKYLIDDKNKPHRVDPSNKNLLNGCQVELTKIEFNGKLLFSFGFESLGEDKRLMSSFRAICKQTISELPKMRLTAAQSFSYPTLLAKSLVSQDKTKQTAKGSLS